MNKTTRLFCDDNGKVLCESHAGLYLSQELKADPSKKLYFTPRGSWLDVTGEEGFGN